MKLVQIIAALSLLTIISCQKEVDYNIVTGKAELHFTNVVGTRPLSFDTPYFTPHNEDFVVSKFKYYITNIAFIDSAGYAHKIDNSYYLLDQSNPGSLTLSLQDDVGSYRSIQFLLGVDSLHNVSGAQSGALDPALDMFWTWSTGYIMAKMEGTSSFSTLQNNRIEYHIGGFEGPESVLRTVTLPFTQNYTLSSDKTLTININADLLAWFSGSNDLSITTYPTCSSPGLLASHYADNYSKMFTITSMQ